MPRKFAITPRRSDVVRCVVANAGQDPLVLPRFESQVGEAMSDASMTGSFQIKLPRELAQQVKKSTAGRPAKMQVEQWKTSWISRLIERLIVGKDS
jgi:hypothetical protein